MADLEVLRTKYAGLSNAEKVSKWQAAKYNSAAWSLIEAELRILIAAEAFAAEDGTHYLDIGEGNRLKCEKRTNYTISSDIGEVDAALASIRNTGNEGQFLAGRLLKTEYKLVVKEYRDLAPQYRTFLDRVVTSKPAMPTLEFVPAKA